MTDDPVADNGIEPSQLLLLNDAIERLEEMHPDWFRVVDLHIFMGCSLREIAEEILEVSYKTIRRRWELARAFLYRQMEAT